MLKATGDLCEWCKMPLFDDDSNDTPTIMVCECGREGCEECRPHSEWESCPDCELERAKDEDDRRYYGAVVRLNTVRRELHEALLVFDREAQIHDGVKKRARAGGPKSSTRARRRRTT